jgi:uncharacterized protein
VRKWCWIAVVLISSSLVIGLSSGWCSEDGKLARQAEIKQGTEKNMEQLKKVVFHLDWDQEEPLAMALENIKNLFKAVPSQECRVRVVANGKAVKLFHKDKVGAHAADIEELHNLGVRFMACRNALTKNNMDRPDLFPLCDIVPAGVVELINLQAQGFAYIKP